MARFKARARTLDMLGRQQIAGIPTAISELFKNAHDAYADNVEVDYYRSDRLFVLRDDGLGMTEQDFQERWLTIGTESKLQKGKGLVPPLKDPDKPERPILGEKGIGRLSIASIGPQVLILSRAKIANGLHNLVAAFINWGLFELPGIDLDEVVIPVNVFPSGSLPNRRDIMDMVDEVKSNVKSLEKNGKITSQDSNRLQKQLNNFDLDPQELDVNLKEPSLIGDGYGTHFFILPAYKSLQSDIEGEKWRTSAPKLTALLVGFMNTMSVETEQRIKVKFRDHKTEDYYVDLIEEGIFFTPEEFQMADHHFQGEFDEYGQFKGKVTIFGEKTFDHVINFRGARRGKTLCGPFKINVAYVQGSRSQSKIPPENYGLIMRKVAMIGGLYIYKEGIRILPYGDSDVDWLDIEKKYLLNLKRF